MKRVFVAITTISALCSSGAYSADYSEGVYIGVGVSQTSAKVDLGSNDLGITDKKTYRNQAIDLRIGKSFNENFAIEGRVGTGLSKGKSNFSVTVQGVDVGVNTTAKLSNYYGIYAVGKYPVGDFTPYVILGASSVGYKLDATASANGLSYSASDKSTDSSASFGVGVDYSINKSTSAGIEYTRLISKSDLKIDALSLSGKFKFSE